jgi:hypothetical protein
MSSITCLSCGAEIADGARFCRQCGQHLTAIAPANVLEATTKTLETPAEGGVTTQRLNPKPTSPNYQSELTPQPSLMSKGLSVARQKRNAFIGGLTILAIALISVVILTSLRNRDSALVSRSLIYPGAETVLDMTRGEEGVLELRTGDPFDKVVEWYVANLKPTKNAKLSKTSVLLKTDEITVGIATEDNKTNILIKQPVAR